MCGRYTHLFQWRQLHRLMTLVSPPWEFSPRYNVAPTQSAPVVRAEPAGRRVDPMRWGLIPSWASDVSIGSRLINARAETIAEKPAFRSAFKSRRCLVPVSGFYEWKAIPGEKRKQPHYIRPSADDDLFFFAGLWERWSPKDGAGDPIESFTIITTQPNELMATLHNRMPVILDPPERDAWLAADASPASLPAMLRPYPSELMMALPVSLAVNNPRHDAEDCILPVGQGSIGEKNAGIAADFD
jgi:putative SOS response-associated peptidase YedK